MSVWEAADVFGANTTKVERRIADIIIREATFLSEATFFTAPSPPTSAFYTNRPVLLWFSESSYRRMFHFD
jgi:hypothetical protein